MGCVTSPTRFPFSRYTFGQFSWLPGMSGLVGDHSEADCSWRASRRVGSHCFLDSTCKAKCFVRYRSSSKARIVATCLLLCFLGNTRQTHLVCKELVKTVVWRYRRALDWRGEICGTAEVAQAKLVIYGNISLWFNFNMYASDIWDVSLFRW